ncbi:phosphohistidine phosphatase, SixA [Minicystis rosea]|nr:phosphohistidine phosphatase, SixA [Minicystis rosea]
MKILLIRHGHAVDEAPGLGDAGRWLSAKGRRVTRKVAAWLSKRDKRTPTVIWTSPLVRAVQTAEIIAERVEYDGELEAISELTPGRDPGDLVKRLGEHPVDGVLAVVGHEPSLTLLSQALVGDVGFTGFKKSGVMGVDWKDGKGTLRFVLDPSTMKAKKQLDAPPAPQEPAAAAEES